MREKQIVNLAKIIAISCAVHIFCGKNGFRGARMKYVQNDLMSDREHGVNNYTEIICSSVIL